jgi:hypothetical protein
MEVVTLLIARGVDTTTSLTGQAIATCTSTPSSSPTCRAATSNTASSSTPPRRCASAASTRSLPHGALLPRAREVATAVVAVDASFHTELRAAYHRRGNLGTDDALDAERAASSRREIAADGIAARRDEIITRGHRRIKPEGH